MNYGNAYSSYDNKYIGNVILTFITSSFCDNIVVQYERNDMGDLIYQSLFIESKVR